MPLEKPSDHGKDINTESSKRLAKDFIKQQYIILDTPTEHLRERIDKTPIDFLTPEERQAFESGDEKSEKKELAKQIYGSAQLMKDLRRTDAEIEEFVNLSVRQLLKYKQYYGNVESSSQHQGEINEGSLPQQQREVIVLSDSEEEGEKSPKQKQPPESRSHEGENWRFDQAREDTSPNKGQRIDSAILQYQLYEQQQSKGKDLDPMEIHDKTGSSDHLRPLDQVGQGQATLTEQHEVHDQADPTRQADASSHSDHLGVDLDVVYRSLEFRNSEVEELNKEIQKCKDYPKKQNRAIKAKREEIKKIYYKNKKFLTEQTENITKDLTSNYAEVITNDLTSEYRGNAINDLMPEYEKSITNNLKSENIKNLIAYLSSNYTEKLINDLISEYKEGIKNVQNTKEVNRIEGEFIGKYKSKGFDTKSSEELIKLVREIKNLQELIQTNQHIMSSYERQRDKILSVRHEIPSQAEASGLADHLGASLDNLDLEFGDLEFREPHDQIQATSSQSFPEIRQPFAAHYPAETQRESTSQQADVRRQDPIEQRQDTIVQQHERHDQAGPHSKEVIKQRLRTFVDNLIGQRSNITENKVNEMLDQNNIYAQKDLTLYRDYAAELSNEIPDQRLKRRYKSIAYYIGQRLTQRQ